MFNRILVPLDGSSLAESALPHAVEFARIFESKIFLLHVLDPSSYHENPNAVDPLNWQIRKAEADVYMSGITEKVQKNLGIDPTADVKQPKSSAAANSCRVNYFIWEGKSAETIINFAHTKKIDLLIISTHGSSGLSRWNISSVTQKVINLIYLPVLIIRSYNELESVHEKMHYRKILLPIDSSRRAEFAISSGIALASGAKPVRSHVSNQHDAVAQTNNLPEISQTKLIFVTVIKPPEILFPEPFPLKITRLIEELMEVNRDAAKMYLEEMRERLPDDCETRVIEHVSVNTAIHELSIQEEDIDLIILCAHGYTGQSTYPYGSIAHHNIQYGTKPVLIIQDVPRVLVEPTVAENISEKFGDR